MVSKRKTNAVSDDIVEDTAAELEAADDGDLADIFAPWDKYAWERLREVYPSEAAALERAIKAGKKLKDISTMGDDRGYSPKAVNWLLQAAAHVKRDLALQMVAEPDAEPVAGRKRFVEVPHTSSSVTYVPSPATAAGVNVFNTDADGRVRLTDEIVTYLREAGMIS